jgi:hypothetical protein
MKEINWCEETGFDLAYDNVQVLPDMRVSMYGMALRTTNKYRFDEVDRYLVGLATL